MEIKKRYDLAKKKYGFEPTPEMLCPKWNYCSCNKCILHKDYSKLQTDSSDKDKKCKCPKQIRKQIGKLFNLKNKGLSEREISSAKVWDNLSAEEKARRTQKLKENSPFVRLKQKGYAITRVSKQTSNFTQATDTETPKTTPTEINSDDSSNTSHKILTTPEDSGVFNRHLKNLKQEKLK